MAIDLAIFFLPLVRNSYRLFAALHLALHFVVMALARQLYIVSSWPSGTIANASSTYSGNDEKGVSYPASNAINGALDDWWNE